MAPKNRTIPVSKLLLDQDNPRLGEEQPSQAAAEQALGKLLNGRLVSIAEHILENGLDPSSRWLVTTEDAPPGKYRVIEGNRRLLALRALRNPKVAESIFTTPARRKTLERMSAAFLQDPIKSVDCAVFDTEEDAVVWIELRHTGENAGIGLVEWNSNEQDRYRSRHGRKNRKPAGQIIDFVDRLRPPGDAPKRQRIYTNIERVISTREVRETLGIVIDRGVVYSLYPAGEVIKSLGAVVDDQRGGAVKVTDVYYKDNQLAYVKGFSADRLPDLTTKLNVRVSLEELANGVSPTSRGASREESDRKESNHDKDNSNVSTFTSDSASSGATGGTPGDGGAVEVDRTGDTDFKSQTASATSGTPVTRPSRAKPPTPRNAVIPRDCVLWIPDGRINAIYHELLNIDIATYTNAAAVLLRVFVELGADHHIDKHNVIPEGDRRSANLSKKLKELAKFFRGKSAVSEKLEKAVIKIADGSGMFSASTTTFNQYVHNSFTYPTPAELRAAWDELQPFMMVLWVK